MDRGGDVDRRRQGRAVDQHHRQAEFAGRDQLGGGPMTAAVLADQQFDPVLPQQRELTLECERSTGTQQRVSWGQREVRWIDGPHDVVVPVICGEGGKIAAPRGEQDGAAGGEPLVVPCHECRSVRDRGHPVPAVAVHGRPPGPAQHQQRDPDPGARGDRVLGDPGRERVGGIDDGANVFGGQVTGQAVDPAETADPHLAGRQPRFIPVARQRRDDGDLAPGLQAVGEGTCLTGTAQHQHPHRRSVSTPWWGGWDCTHSHSAHPETGRPGQTGAVTSGEGRREGALRRGWTTGACATAATLAAYNGLLTGEFPDPVTITLPKGQTPSFALTRCHLGDGDASAAVTKDAGDDPDVTHGAVITSTVRPGTPGTGVRFVAGPGVGTVTKPGLPLPVGEPAINPVPRRLMTEAIAQVAAAHRGGGDVVVEISVDDGAQIARHTWNPRLGILGGISILGTTGVVVPYSCSAWIDSIRRGIDVARAAGHQHVAGCTGSTSEATVRRLYGLPDDALLDMGDFVGAVLK
jgi:hypothetical protein